MKPMVFKMHYGFSYFITSPVLLDFHRSASYS